MGKAIDDEGGEETEDESTEDSATEGERGWLNPPHRFRMPSLGQLDGHELSDRRLTVFEFSGAARANARVASAATRG
jgi:hypothetical protein